MSTARDTSSKHAATTAFPSDPGGTIPATLTKGTSPGIPPTATLTASGSGGRFGFRLKSNAYSCSQHSALDTEFSKVSPRKRA